MQRVVVLGTRSGKLRNSSRLVLRGLDVGVAPPSNFTPLSLDLLNSTTSCPRGGPLRHVPPQLQLFVESPHPSMPTRKPQNIRLDPNPPWRNWLARQTVNLEVLSSTLSGGDLCCPDVLTESSSFCRGVFLFGFWWWDSLNPVLVLLS